VYVFPGGKEKETSANRGEKKGSIGSFVRNQPMRKRRTDRQETDTKKKEGYSNIFWVHGTGEKQEVAQHREQEEGEEEVFLTPRRRPTLPKYWGVPKPSWEKSSASKLGYLILLTLLHQKKKEKSLYQ